MSKIEDKYWSKIEPFPMAEEEVVRSCAQVLSKAKMRERQFKQRSRREWLRRAVSYSVAAILLIGVPLMSLWYVNKTETAMETLASADYMEFATRNGEIREVILPDSSKVVLNAGSILLYPEKFADTRCVYLTGEAVFDVTASKKHPFIVRTSDVNVKVHGTRFNVSAYNDDDNVNVTLCRGAVNVKPNKSDAEPFELRPGQNYCFSKSDCKSVVTDVNPAESTIWETGDLFFKAQDIHSVAKTIGRRFGVNIYVTSGKFDRAIITAKFVHGETLDEQMRAICSLVPGMKYSIEGDNVYLK